MEQISFLLVSSRSPDRTDGFAAGLDRKPPLKGTTFAMLFWPAIRLRLGSPRPIGRGPARGQRRIGRGWASSTWCGLALSATKRARNWPWRSTTATVRPRPLLALGDGGRDHRQRHVRATSRWLMTWRARRMTMRGERNGERETILLT